MDKCKRTATGFFDRLRNLDRLKQASVFMVGERLKATDGEV